jgi:hypothetical protein
MRAILFAIAACSYVPEPQGPRTVCNGTIVASNNVAAMSSECEEIPADPCWNVDPEDTSDEADECQREEQRRQVHNSKVERNRVLTGFALVIVGVVALGYAATN